MAVTAPAKAAAPTPPAAPQRRSVLHAEVFVAAGAVVVALVLAGLTSSSHLGPTPTVLLGALATLVLFALSGVALALVLVPRAWGPLVPLLSVPLGAAASGLALTALGFARVPLRVSLWVVLAAGCS
jgi:hypothetical protein